MATAVVAHGSRIVVQSCPRLACASMGIAVLNVSGLDLENLSRALGGKLFENAPS